MEIKGVGPGGVPVPVSPALREVKTHVEHAEKIIDIGLEGDVHSLDRRVDVNGKDEGAQEVFRRIIR